MMADNDGALTPYWAELHPSDLRRAGLTPNGWQQFAATAIGWPGDQPWVFHGTSSDRWQRIASEGLVATPQRVGVHRGDTSEIDGVCFGDIRIALYHAIFCHRRDHSKPILVAANIAELETLFAIRPDQAAVELPFENIIGRSYREVSDAWRLDQDKDWRSSLAISGCLVIEGSVPIKHLHLADDSSSLEWLAASLNIPTP